MQRLFYKFASIERKSQRRRKPPIRLVILAALTLLATQLVDATPVFATTYTYDATPGTTIPDESCPTYTSTTITVGDLFTVDDLVVGMNISHRRRSHLEARLTSPQATTIELFNGVGDREDHVDVYFDDDAATDAGSMAGDHNTLAPLYDGGTFNPQGSVVLSSFDGEAANGDWIFEFCDDTNRGAGTILNLQLSFEGTPIVLTNTISGNVFMDLNYNGNNDSESGVNAITVTAFAADGTVAGTATTNGAGNYAISGLTDGVTYRIEFSNLPADHTLSPNGTDSNSAVRFVTSPDTSVNLGIYEPQEGVFCSAGDAQYVVSCFVNGDPTDPSNVGETSIARFNYLAGGTAQMGESGYVNIAHMDDTGPVWGVAYDELNGYLYSSAVIKRHSGAGPDGIGAIYRQTDTGDASTVTLFHDFGSDVGTIDDNATRFPGSGDAAGEEGPCANCDNIDPNAFSWIGQRAFGDIDVSTDGSTLYVINLFDRKLYTVNTSGSSSHSEVAGAPWLTNADCNDNAGGSDSGVARPWAVSVNGSDVYVGVVCDASSSITCNSSNSCADLTAHVYKLSGATWTTAMASSPLTYSRDLYASATGADDVWHPWSSTYSDIDQHVEGVTDVSYPQPILGDIEFAEEGHMILSFLDRSSMQFGYAAPAPDDVTASLITIEYFSAGDILHATESGGVYTLQTTEFYDDQWANSGSSNPLSGNNNDTATGGAAYAPGLGILIQGLSDAVDVYSAGVGFFSSADGGVNAAQEVFQGSTASSSPFFAKAGGLGDIEMLCSVPTYYVEIGNRLWIDSNSDGIQDPDEAPLAGVTVELMAPDGTTVLGTAITDAEGNYSFSSAPGSSSGNAIYGIAGLLANTNGYTVRINTNQAALISYSPTTANTDPGVNGDSRDSDGVVNDDYVEVSFNSGEAGENNFSFDFGFITASPTAVTFSAGSGTALFQSPVALASIMIAIMIGAFVLISRRARNLLQK